MDVRLLMTLTAIALAPVVVAAQNTQTAVTPGNAENGRKLYTAYYCYACHGTVGQGGAAGPRLAPNPPPLAAVRSYLRRPSGVMPPYTAKVVSDQELADIHAFLRSIASSRSPADIPLLSK
jgi:ubiquinol-cytochrome c reductase cytochrome c subunit